MVDAEGLDDAQPRSAKRKKLARGQYRFMLYISPSKIQESFMRHSILFVLLLWSSAVSAQNRAADSVTLKRISNEVLTNYQCYNDLRDLCKQIGARISGSPQAAQAVAWGERDDDCVWGGSGFFVFV